MKITAFILIFLAGSLVCPGQSDAVWIAGLPKQEAVLVKAALLKLDTLVLEEAAVKAGLLEDIGSLYLEYDSIYIGIKKGTAAKAVYGAVSGSAFSETEAVKELSRIERKAEEMLAAHSGGLAQAPFSGNKKRTVRDIRTEIIAAGASVSRACKSLDLLDPKLLEAFCLSMTEKGFTVPLRRDIMALAFGDPIFSGKAVRLSIARSLCLMDPDSVLDSIKRFMTAINGPEGKLGLVLASDLAAFHTLDKSLLYRSPVMMTAGALPDASAATLFSAFGELSKFRKFLITDQGFCIPAARFLAKLKTLDQGETEKFCLLAKMETNSLATGILALESFLASVPERDEGGIQPDDVFSSLVLVRKAEAEYRLILESGNSSGSTAFQEALSAMVSDKTAVGIFISDPFFKAFRDSLTERNDFALDKAVESAVHAASVSVLFGKKTAAATGKVKPLGAEIKGAALRADAPFVRKARITLEIRSANGEIFTLAVTDPAASQAFFRTWSDTFLGSGSGLSAAAKAFCPALVTYMPGIQEIVLESGSAMFAGAGAVADNVENTLPLVPPGYFDAFAASTKETPGSQFQLSRNILYIDAMLGNESAKGNPR